MSFHGYEDIGETYRHGLVVLKSEYNLVRCTEHGWYFKKIENG